MIAVAPAAGMATAMVTSRRVLVSRGPPAIAVGLDSSRVAPSRRHRATISLRTIVVLLCTLSLVAAPLLQSLAVSSRSSSSSSLDPFDPSAYDIHMSSSERAYRAAHQPGGEVSYCCCYCGRGGRDDQDDEQDEEDEEELLQNEGRFAVDDPDAVIDGIPAQDAWLYRSLPNQPRPEIGDPVDRLARRRHRRAHARASAAVVRDTPYGTIEPGVAQFILFKTVQSRCDNEYCIDQSDVCFRSHLWTGWAGAITSSAEPPVEKVRGRCETVYQREMEVLADFNGILDQQKQTLAQSSGKQ